MGYIRDVSYLLSLNHLQPPNVYIYVMMDFFNTMSEMNTELFKISRTGAAIGSIWILPEI